jgi:hypothetical protein
MIQRFFSIGSMQNPDERPCVSIIVADAGARSTRRAGPRAAGGRADTNRTASDGRAEMPPAGMVAHEWTSRGRGAGSRNLVTE